MLKVQDVFTLIKLIFMFDYIRCCVPDDLNRVFTFNYDIHSYITRSSEEFHISYTFELLNKETNLTKSTFLKHLRLIELYLLLFLSLRVYYSMQHCF